MKKSLLFEALKLSLKGLDSHPQYDNFIHFTYFVVDNQIVSNGVNCSHEPDKRWGYHGLSLLLGDSFKPKLHSELNCLRRCRSNIRGATAINVRLSKKGEPRQSCPCEACFNVLKVVGIKKVYFTTSSNWACMDIA